MGNPNSLTKEMKAFAKEKARRVPSLLELSLAWDEIEKGLANGWSKKLVWEWLVRNERFSYNYITFLRTLPKQIKLNEEKKRKEDIEKRRSELAKQKLSESERLNAIFKSYEQE